MPLGTMALPVHLGMARITAVLGKTLRYFLQPGQTSKLPLNSYFASKSLFLFSCPYVTNVGATKVYPGKTVFDPESAVVDPIGEPYSRAYSSGGGFSNIYGQPKYQQAAVK